MNTVMASRGPANRESAKRSRGSAMKKTWRGRCLCIRGRESDGEAARVFVVTKTGLERRQCIWNGFFVCIALQRNNNKKLETNIPRKGIAWPQSQFPHSCVCERFIYSHNWSAYANAEKYVDRSWEYINRSQTHECGNWDWGRAIPRKGMGFSLQCATRRESAFHWKSDHVYCDMACRCPENVTKDKAWD